MLTCLICFSASVLSAAAPDAHQATGVKIGEVTESSAIVWVRVTADSARKFPGFIRPGRPALRPPTDVKLEDWEGACPGMPGRARLRYGTQENLSDATVTPWQSVSADSDYATQFTLKGLNPETKYYFATEAAGPDDGPTFAPLRGTFKTAPPADERCPVTFTVITCQTYGHRDRPDGFKIYKSMIDLDPDFTVNTGDSVYYDNYDPIANSIAVARYHWDRMYSLPLLVDFHRQIPTYWQKDDHDTYADDCWPGQIREAMLPFTFAEGQKVFLEEVPMSEKLYRTFRWGKTLQIWLTEGRDFRSPNQAPDGPNKTIWGPEQKRWLKESLLASDADWKVLINPAPIVGPDRPKKSDSHANKVFATEGNEIREWIQKNLPDNLFVMCGDRHWHYFSVDPKTGVREFSTGPASDSHAEGSPGYNPVYHRFHLVKGGFISVQIRPVGQTSTITFRFHDVNGKVLHEYQAP